MVAEHSELRSGMQFRIMVDPIRYELRVATGTSVKFYSLTLFTSFKASPVLSLSRITHAQMLQQLFALSVKPITCNFFLDLLIHQICRLLSASGICLVGVLLMIRVLHFQNTNFWWHIQAMWNSLPKADIQNLFGSMPRRLVALIAARDGYTKY